MGRSTMGKQLCCLTKIVKILFRFAKIEREKINIKREKCALCMGISVSYI